MAHTNISRTVLASKVQIVSFSSFTEVSRKTTAMHTQTHVLVPKGGSFMVYEKTFPLFNICSPMWPGSVVGTRPTLQHTAVVPLHCTVVAFTPWLILPIVSSKPQHYTKRGDYETRRKPHCWFGLVPSPQYQQSLATAENKIKRPSFLWGSFVVFILVFIWEEGRPGLFGKFSWYSVPSTFVWGWGQVWVWELSPCIQNPPFFLSILPFFLNS